MTVNRVLYVCSKPLQALANYHKVKTFCFRRLQGLSLVFALGTFCAFHASVAAEPKGVVILVKTSGEVKIQVDGKLDPAGKPLFLPAEEVRAGASIFDGHTVITGKNGAAVLLFSNGAVTTLKADSGLNVRTFTQAKFKSSGKKLNELQSEPSTSRTAINLDFGGLIIDVKNLNERSTFDIGSPVGTAGIRSRATVAVGVRPRPGGGWVGRFLALKGSIAFTPPPLIPTIEVPNAPVPPPIPVAGGQKIVSAAPPPPPFRRSSSSCF